MRIYTLAIVVPTLLFLAACASVEVPPPPHQGIILSADGGAAGYQHGHEGSRFMVGQHSRRFTEHSYLKQTGDEGTLAISQGNGSVFGVPNASATSLRKPPFGATPKDHDAFVMEYFVKLGLPAEQVEEVRGMTLLV